MKKFAIAALCFVLTISLLTACRGGSSADETQTSTSSATQSTTRPTTAPTTAPTSAPSSPSGSMQQEDGMIDGQGDAARRGGRVDRNR